MSEAVRKPKWVLAQNRALNLRPCGPELREALRTLAKAHGEEMYLYALRVLREHVEAQSGTSTATEDATR
jgi:hypothetical protein